MNGSMELNHNITKTLDLNCKVTLMLQSTIFPSCILDEMSSTGNKKKQTHLLILKVT